MRVLQLHSDWIEYELVKKEITTAEKCEEKRYRFEDLLVLFVSVEEGDNQKVAEKLIDEVEDFMKKIKANKILIYPYAHLSNNLAKPATALKLLRAMEKYAKQKGIETHRTPFGWCKKFSLSIKGHPLAEQLRVIEPGGKKEKVEDRVSEALKAEEKLKSFWYIIKPDGKMVPVDKFDFSKHKSLEKLARYEIAKSRAVQQVPPHVKLMRKLEIADYESGSDPGNFRWYPKGTLIKSLLEQYVTAKTVEYGAMEVETPVMYDFHHPTLAKYLDRFPARQYVVKSEDKELFLRFSACFGQFLMAHDAQISYRHLPLRIYELTRYSFRREKSGELVGLRRLRAFTMPDCHALCADLEQAKREMIQRFDLCVEILEEGLELVKGEDYELAIRFTKDFYKENRDFINALVKRMNRPALVEMWEQRFFYFILKWEFNFIDNSDKASALSTDQIDVENGERYGITYVDEKAEKKNPLILHCSPSGAIERCIYAMLEKAYRQQMEGKPPMLPLWLSPTQIRVIPLSDSFLSYAEKMANEIEKNCIRVDIDDRALTMQKKVREAETEWIPYIVVIGKKEVEGETLPVRDRKTGKIKKMKLRELIEEIKRETSDKPFKPLTLPKHLSQRPQFYG
jgi:threonyl-tRNA synthetase